MAEWDTDLREVVAEQMYLLRRTVNKAALPWGQLSDGMERRAAYKDADRIMPFIIVREACLRTHAETERGRALSWEQRTQDMAAQIDRWRDRAIAAEAALVDVLARPAAPLADDDPGRVTPSPRTAEGAVVVAFPTGKPRGGEPQDPVSPERPPSLVSVEYDALISDALSTFRLLAAE